MATIEDDSGRTNGMRDYSIRKLPFIAPQLVQRGNPDLVVSVRDIQNLHSNPATPYLLDIACIPTAICEDCGSPLATVDESAVEIPAASGALTEQRLMSDLWALKQMACSCGNRLGFASRLGNGSCLRNIIPRFAA